MKSYSPRKYGPVQVWMFSSFGSHFIEHIMKFWHVMPPKLQNCNCLLFATCFADYLQRNFFRKASCEKSQISQFATQSHPWLADILKMCFRNFKFTRNCPLTEIYTNFAHRKAAKYQHVKLPLEEKISSKKWVKNKKM